MKIFKFTLDMLGRQKVDLPKTAHILTVQEQQGLHNMWALVEPNEEIMPRTIHIYGTGQNVGEDVLDRERYLATVQQGNLVWHIFEVQ